MKEIWQTYVEVSMGGQSQHFPKFAQFAYNYKKFFPKDKKAKVLDVGIGRGEMLGSMREWGYENYLGVDISSSTVDFCKSQNLHCELVKDTLSWLVDHPQEFSVITLLDVLEHISKNDVIEFLHAVRGALVPGGVLIVQTPNMDAPESYLHRYNDFTHLVGFTQNSLNQVLQAAGFSSGGLIFFGFEVFIGKRLVFWLLRACRYFLWIFIRIFRIVMGNLRPKILHPVLVGVAYK